MALELHLSWRHAIALCEREAEAENYIVICPLIGGIPPELAWPGLELFGEKVIPTLKAKGLA